MTLNMDNRTGFFKTLQSLGHAAGVPPRPLTGLPGTLLTLP